MEKIKREEKDNYYNINTLSNLKLVSTIFYQIRIFQQMIVLQKL